jgi:ATP-binding cassette subfamily G (WHITE) protein 2
MTDSSGLSIPPFTTQDAHSQLIDIQWQNLSVYVGMPKSNTARNQVSDDLSSPLLLKGKSSQAQFDNVKAQELSQASSKYTYRCILDNQCGFARRGELLAIMGPSGAGKTTMIACLSQRLA